MIENNGTFSQLVNECKADLGCQIISSLYILGRYTIQIDIRINEFTLKDKEERRDGLKNLLKDVGTSINRNEIPDPVAPPLEI